jgi:hypothetical protein
MRNSRVSGLASGAEFGNAKNATAAKTTRRLTSANPSAMFEKFIDLILIDYTQDSTQRWPDGDDPDSHHSPKFLAVEVGRGKKRT